MTCAAFHVQISISEIAAGFGILTLLPDTEGLIYLFRIGEFFLFVDGLFRFRRAIKKEIHEEVNSRT